MSTEITVPLLPCHAIDPMLEFYRALGFEVTYQQAKPNAYAVVVRGGIELHFFTMKGYDPAGSYSTCYVRTGEVDALYKAFCDGLKAAYTRVPSAGIPRVIPLKDKTGRREFIVVDPGGNWIRIGQPTETSSEKPAEKQAATRLGRALNAATILSDIGHDDQAATMLDAALAHAEPAAATDRVRTLIFRAGVAVTMGDAATAGRMLDDAAGITLTKKERSALAGEIARADELRQMTAQG